MAAFSFRAQREVRPEPQRPFDEDPTDRPEALLNSLFELNALINTNAGRLPVEAVVIGRQITDVIREMIDGALADQGSLDIHETVSIKGVLSDYLPTTLRTYLALDPSVVDTPRPAGSTPRQALIEQLETLWESSADLRDSSRAHDADALMAQGSFLRTKFSGSDLDL